MTDYHVGCGTDCRFNCDFYDWSVGTCGGECATLCEVEKDFKFWIGSYRKESGMKVKIQFISASVPTEFDGVKDVYTKDGLVCVSFISSKRIIKFPLVNVFSIESEYEV